MQNLTECPFSTFCPLLSNILKFAWANWKVMNFNLFYIFFFMFHTYYVIFCDIFALFLAQNFKTKVLTAQNNLLLECLGGGSVALVVGVGDRRQTYLNYFVWVLLSAHIERFSFSHIQDFILRFEFFHWRS